MIQPAQGVRGFLLYDHGANTYFFRVYDPEDKRKYKDYELAAADIAVEILDRFTVLQDGTDGEPGKLTYPATGITRPYDMTVPAAELSQAGVWWRALSINQMKAFEKKYFPQAMVVYARMIHQMWEEEGKPPPQELIPVAPQGPTSHAQR